MGFDQVKGPSGSGLKEKENSLAKMISFWGKETHRIHVAEEERRCLEGVWRVTGRTEMSGRGVQSHRKNGDVWKGCRESQEERRCLEGV